MVGGGNDVGVGGVRLGGAVPEDFIDCTDFAEEAIVRLREVPGGVLGQNFSRQSKFVVLQWFTVRL